MQKFNRICGRLLLTVASLALLFLMAEETRADTNIIALNVFNEARNQPLAGKIAVAEVTLNRMESKSFPSTARGVVYQKNQFSWTHHPQTVKTAAQAKKLDPKSWAECVKAAKMAQFSRDKYSVAPKGSTHFYADYIKTPKWAMNKKKRKIGNHYFLYQEA